MWVEATMGAVLDGVGSQQAVFYNFTRKPVLAHNSIPSKNNSQRVEFIVAAGTPSEFVEIPPDPEPTSKSGQRSHKTAKGGSMTTKTKAKTSRKRKSGSSSSAKEETPVKQEKGVAEEASNAEEEKQEEKEKPSKSSSKGRRRQSSPRGRRAVKFDPEDYIYNRLLIYTDGAARGNPGESGAGVVLKTPEGEEVGRFGRYLGKGTNNFAEYQALLLGLQHAQEFGANDITILSDSDLLVRQLMGEYRVRAAHLRVLFDEAQQMLAEFDKYQIKRIEREKNREADSMANRAIDERL